MFQIILKIEKLIAFFSKLNFKTIKKEEMLKIVLIYSKGDVIVENNSIINKLVNLCNHLI